MNVASKVPARFGKKMVKNLLMYILLILVALIFVGPFLWLLSTSLKPATQGVFSYPPTLIPEPPVFSNFVRAWNAVPLGKYMLNSLILVAVIVPGNLLISSLAAYPLARMKFPARNFIFLAILATMFLPEESKLVPLYILVQEMGMTNSWSGLIFPVLAGGLQVFLLRQAFLVIPKEIEQAAVVDGCGHWRMFWQVMLPLTKPTLATAGVFSFISVWDSFIWPLIILNDDSLYPIALGLNYLMGTFDQDIRGLAAGTILSLIPVVIFYLAMQRYFIEGISGAVKQ